MRQSYDIGLIPKYCNKFSLCEGDNVQQMFELYDHFGIINLVLGLAKL